MSELDDRIEITPGPGGSYNVFSGFSKDTIAFSPAGLLALADWITAHRGELARRVHGDDARDELARQLRNERGTDEQ